MENVNKLIRTGFKWNTVYILISSILLPLSYIFLAKFMGKNEFGTLAIIMVFINLSDMISQFGISQAIISKKTITDIELNSLFWSNLLLGIFLSIAGFFSANFVSRFYSNMDLAYLVQIASVVFFLKQIPLISRAILQKKMRFEVLTPFEIVELLLKISISLVLTYMGYGVLGFLIGQIAATVIFSILILGYFLKAKYWKPSFVIRLSSLKSFYGFGFWVTLKSVLNFIGANADIILIGKFFPTSVLGSYNFAKKIIQEPRGKLSAVFEKVSYPTFSMMLNENLGGKENSLRSFEKKYLYLIKAISYMGFPIFGLLMVSAPYLMESFFDPKWKDSIVLIQIFCVSTIFELISSGFSSSALYSLGLPQKVTKVDMFITPIRLLLILFLGLYSSQIEYIALLYVVLVVVKVLILQGIINSNTGLNFFIFFSNIKTQFLTIFVAVLISRGIFFFGFNYEILSIFLYILIVAVLYYFFSKRIISFMIKDLKKTFLSKNE